MPRNLTHLFNRGWEQRTDGFYYKGYGAYTAQEALDSQRYYDKLRKLNPVTHGDRYDDSRGRSSKNYGITAGL